MFLSNKNIKREPTTELEKKRIFRGLFWAVSLIDDQTLNLPESIALAEIQDLQHPVHGCTALNEHFARFLRTSPDRAGRVIANLEKLRRVRIRLVKRKVGNPEKLPAGTYRHIYTPEHSNAPAQREFSQTELVTVRQKRRTGYGENDVRGTSEITDAPVKNDVPRPSEITAVEIPIIDTQIVCVETTDTHTPIFSKKGKVRAADQAAFTGPRSFHEAHGEAFEIIIFELLQIQPALESINLIHYAKKAARWSKSDGKKSLDWLEKIQTFIDNDRGDNRLHHREGKRAAPVIEAVTAAKSLFLKGSEADFFRRIHFLNAHFSEAVANGMPASEPQKTVEMLARYTADPAAAAEFFQNKQPQKA